MSGSGPVAELAVARRALEQRGEVRPAAIGEGIAASWRRCLAHGLDPARLPREDAVDETSLARFRERSGLVWRLARAEIAGLRDQIAGSNHMIAFANPDGLLLDTMIDGSFRRPASDHALQPGMRWSERLRGTNALGLALATRRPAIVHGAEHFFRFHAGLTCAATPVMAPDGSLAGILDVSSSSPDRQTGAAALLGLAAMQIENGLFRADAAGATLVAFHSRRDYLGTPSAGLLAISADGRIVRSSPQAAAMLHGLELAAETSWEALFRGRHGDLLFGREAGERFELCARNGARYAAELVAVPAPPKRRRESAGPAPAQPASARGAGAPPGATGGLVTEDAAVAAAFELVARASRRGLPILIGGETGTGKEGLARAAHRASSRAGRFVPVNCAALPGGLIEAELFGHAEGAFTGARRGGAPGLALEADGGTLFLDEIGDMDPGAQAALLRLLDDWTVRPVGATAGRQVDVLLVAASNVPLAEAARQGRLRTDLLHRLSVVTVRLPRLAARTDLASLAAALLAAIDPDARLRPEALERLAAHDWPGNIRELRNVLTRASLETASVDAAAIGRALAAAGEAPAAAQPASAVAAAAAPEPADAPLSLLAARRIAQMRAELGGSVAETARRLGISRNRVYRAIRLIEGETACRR